MAEPQRPVAQESINAGGARFLIVEARFYDDIGSLLLLGAESVLQQSAVRYDIIQVPGALEIPQALSIALDGSIAANDPYQGAIALGCVIRGETYHFEIVAGESCRALMDISVSRRLPLGNGILTVENEAQALVRARPDQGNKGGDAARAALAVFSLKRAIGKI